MRLSGARNSEGRGEGIRKGKRDMEVESGRRRLTSCADMLWKHVLCEGVALRRRTVV